MEGLLNFLADNYIWFAGVSVFFAFALIGLVYESKKKKKAESKTADAVAQPVTAEATQMAPAQPQNVVVDTPAPSEVVTSGAPSLEGLEANTDNFNQVKLEDASAPQTLVIDDAGTPAPAAEPTLVIDDPAAAPSAEPTLVIDDTPAAPEAPAEVVPEAPAEPQTLGNPGQPPM